MVEIYSSEIQITLCPDTKDHIMNIHHKDHIYFMGHNITFESDVIKLMLD